MYKSLKKFGGLTENRTRVHGFAVRCVTTPPSGRRRLVAGEGGSLTERPAGGNLCRNPIALRLSAEVGGSVALPSPSARTYKHGNATRQESSEDPWPLISPPHG